MLELLGLDDVADQPIESLSLGSGRLVEVGRALMTEPKLLLLDEPSSGLDQSETVELVGTLQEVQREHGIAILLVEHDVELVRPSSTASTCSTSGRDRVGRDRRRDDRRGRPQGVPRGARCDHAVPSPSSPTRAARSSCATSRPATARSAPCSACRSRCAKARCWRCSAPTAPARPPWRGSARASSRRRRASSASTARTSPASARTASRATGIVHAPRAVGVRLAHRRGEPRAHLPPRARAGRRAAGGLDAAYELFPPLGQRRRQVAGTLSGGEQRMLALARVLVGPAPAARRRRAVARPGADRRRRGLPDAGDDPRGRDDAADRRAARRATRSAIADDVVVLVKGKVAYRARSPRWATCSEWLLPSGESRAPSPNGQ